MINPTLESLDRASDDEPRDMKLLCSIPVADLNSAATLLYANDKSTPAEERSTLASVKAGATLPYLDAENNPLVLVDLDGDDDFLPTSSSKKLSSRENSRLVTCGFDGCGEKFQAAQMRQHAAYHLLHDPAATNEMPCGLCGVKTQGQYGSESVGCSAWLEKVRKTMKPRGVCKVVGQVDYSHACAQKFSKGQPSTNHLIKCPECPEKPMPQYFWKYRGMMNHWKRFHSTVTMPESLATVLKITDEEREELKKFAKRKDLAKTKKRKRKEIDRANDQAAQEQRTKLAAEAWAQEKATTTATAPTPAETQIAATTATAPTAAGNQNETTTATNLI